AYHYMDGQLPNNINGAKNIIPEISGVAGGNVFLPSLFAPSQIPTSSSCPTNTADLPWAKNQVFQNWVDQTKNLPNMYNMFTGNMAANGSFGTNLDSSWQNPSSSQSNLNLANPLLAAFQQQYGATNNSRSSSINPLLGSTSQIRTSATAPFDPLALHPTPSALNPPIQQPKQPPKHHADPSSLLFPSTTTSYNNTGTKNHYDPAGTDPSKLNSFTLPPGYDQLRDQLNAMSGQLQQQQQQQSPFSMQPQATPLARPQPRSQGIPPQAFDLLSSVAKDLSSKPAASGFDLSQILPPSAMPTITAPQTTSSIFPTQTQTPSASNSVHAAHPQTIPTTSEAMECVPGPSTSTSDTMRIQTTSHLAVPPADGQLISPRTGKRRSGGQNGDLARPPSEGGLDLDLDGFDLFDGMTMGDQEAVLNSTLNFDDAIFNDPIPTSIAEEPPPQPPKPVIEQPKKEEPKKEEVSSAQSKMQLLMARLQKTRGAAPAAAPVAAATSKAATPTAAASVPSAAGTPATPEPLKVASPAVLPKPAEPQAKSDKPTFTPPLSPVDLSDASKPSTSGISSLIAASILPSELLKKPDPTQRKKNIPVYLRTKPAEQSSSIPIYKFKNTDKKSFSESKDDEFAFTDEDPEETGEKLKRVRDDDWDDEPEKAAHEAKVNYIFNYQSDRITYSKMGYDRKVTDAEPKKEVRKPAPVYPGRDRHARQESLDFAEKLRQRRKGEIKIDFATVQQCEHNQCAIDSGQRNVDDADKPPLPRLLIRLPKKSIDIEEKSRRRRKKRRYYDEGEEESEEDDDDWYGGRPKKRRGRKPKRELHPDETYSVRLVDPSTIEHARKEVHVRPVEYSSRKEKIMRHWREENGVHEEPPAATGRGVEGKLEPKSLTRIVTEYKNAEARERLEKFRPCTGFVPRGTFLVLKAEINTADCSLWRVDNMNLLQKFPGFMVRTGKKGPEKLLYKNSSTYSGWCEQLQPSYMVVEVRHVKQTRSECVVEPLIHIDDLFPAVSEELPERYCVSNLKALINKEDAPAQAEARTFILKDDVRNGLYMVIRNMLDGALTIDYFSRALPSTLGGLPNPSFELLNEIECQLRECEESIKERVSFGLEFECQLKRYGSCLPIDCEYNEIDCQACGEASVQKTLQLFDPIEKLKEEDECYFEEKAVLQAVDFLLCADCCKFAVWQHRLIHFRHDLARRIENRLLEATLEMPSLLPEQIVENLRQHYTWLKEV
ncbi:hypothetical protein PMAYCL1PPCAC_31780, partial [Pristionchus mayeri]